jgi:hypothetical protein
MALTEQTVVEKIEVVGEFSHVQIHTARVIYDGDREIARETNSHVVTPETDASGEGATVRAICAAVHTPAVKAAYGLRVAADKARDRQDAAKP